MENDNQFDNKAEIKEKKKVKNKNDNKQIKYIYFIITYEKSKQLKVYLSQKYKDSHSLEKINDKSLDEYKGFITSDVYRFKIIDDSLNLQNDLEEYQIPVNVESEDKKYKYIIKLRNLKRDFYEYNFEIKELNILPLDYQKQFEIYSEILRNKYQKKQNTPENEDFILSVESLLSGIDKKYNFMFYLLIILECFNTKYFYRHLLLFKPEQINDLGNADNKKLSQIKSILNLLTKKPEKIYIEKENDRHNVIKLFYSMVLFFNVHFQKEKIEEMFENNKIFDYLYENIIKFNNYYRDLILPKKYVIKLIKKADNFNQVLNFLYYLGKDVIQFLEVINEEKTFIKILFQKDITKFEKDNEIKERNEKKEIPIIDVCKYVVPKKEDKIMQLNALIFEIITYQLSFVKLSNSFIEKYIEFNNNVDVNNLILIRNIVQFNFFEADKNNSHKYNLDEIIHKTGLKLIKDGKIKNMEILDFIQSDIFFHDKQFNQKKDRPLEVFDGIDISLMGMEEKEKFFYKWTQCNFYSKFESQLNEYLKKVTSLIKEMKDFRYLFKFYEPTNKSSFRNEVIKNLQTRFIELLSTYNERQCPNFTEDITELIYLSDKKRVEFNKFLLAIRQMNFNINLVNNIYINLVKKHKDLSNECNSIIIKFFTEHPELSDPISLAFLIDKCNNLKQGLFSNINNYVLIKDEIFEKNESNNFIFLKELASRNIIKKIENKNYKYYSETITNLSKIKDFDIKALIIYKFFKEGKQMEEILKERISIAFQYIGGNYIEYFEQLKSKALKVVEVLDNLKLIFQYWIYFYPNVQTENICSITNFIYSLEANNLNNFEINYKNDYDKYIIYLDEAKNGLEKKNSEFYLKIYNDSRKTYKKDDLKCFEVTNIKFNELIKIFEENGIDKIDEKILSLCFKSLIEEKIDISSEMKKLIEIFKINNDKNNVINRIKNDLILFSKREYIINAISSILFFIEQAGFHKGDYTFNIKKVMKSLKEEASISSLKNNITLLKKLDLDLINGDNNYLDILIKLNQKKEIIKFLFNFTIQDCHNLKKIFSEKNNNFISSNDLLDLEKCVEFYMALGNIDDLKSKNDYEIIKLIKENASKTENKNIIIHLERFISNCNRIKKFQSSLVESFIKLTKLFEEDSFPFRLVKSLRASYHPFYEQNNKIIKNNKEMNNLDKYDDLSSDTNDFFSSIFLSEEKDFYNNDEENNSQILYDNKVIDVKMEKELNEIITKLKLDLEKEKEIQNKLNLKINELEKILKYKDEEINREKREKDDLINKIKNFSDNNKIIIELYEKLEKKENEIKELKKILPFEYTNEEKIYVVTFLSSNENIHYSMICKNTDKFQRLEMVFYDKFPENKKRNNIFLTHNKIIDKYNNLEANKISDNDIIVIKSKKDEEK